MNDQRMSIHSSVAEEVASRVATIVASAERAAAEIQVQVEADAARRAHELRVAAEAQAERIRSRAEAEAREYFEQVRREVDAWAQEREARVAAVSDELTRRAEQLERRFAAAETARRQVYDLIAALGVAASEVASAAALPVPVIEPLLRTDAWPADDDLLGDLPG